VRRVQLQIISEKGPACWCGCSRLVTEADAKANVGVANAISKDEHLRGLWSYSVHARTLPMAALSVVAFQWTAGVGPLGHKEGPHIRFYALWAR